MDSTTDRAKNTVVTEEQQAPVREISNIEVRSQLLKKNRNHSILEITIIVPGYRGFDPLKGSVLAV